MAFQIHLNLTFSTCYMYVQLYSKTLYIFTAHLECASIPDFPLCSVVEDAEPVLDFVVVPNPVPSSCMCERASELDTSGLRK